MPVPSANWKKSPGVVLTLATVSPIPSMETIRTVANCPCWVPLSFEWNLDIDKLKAVEAPHREDRRGSSAHPYLNTIKFVRKRRPGSDG